MTIHPDLKLHPDLLRACAAYIEHQSIYALDGSGVLALLRVDARHSKPSTIVDPPPPPGPPRPTPAVRRMPPPPRTDEECDQLIRDHVTAIRCYRPQCSVGQTARAILDATPAMLTWWCDALVKAVQR